MNRAKLRQKLRNLSIKQRLGLIEIAMQTILEDLKDQADTSATAFPTEREAETFANHVTDAIDSLRESGRHVELAESVKSDHARGREEEPREESDKFDYSILSEESLARVWDNEEDAVYDNWKELYSVHEG